jgi:hypothetical protein
MGVIRRSDFDDDDNAGGGQPAGDARGGAGDAVPGSMPVADKVPNPALEVWAKALEDGGGWYAETEPETMPSLLASDGVDAGPFLGAAGLLAGAGAVGKSFAALDLAVKVAAGRPLGGPWQWCGFDILEAGPVVYVAAEDPAPELRSRLFRLTQGLTSEQRTKVRERLTVVPLADTAPELIRTWRLTRGMYTDEIEPAGVRMPGKKDRWPGVSETLVSGSDLVKLMRKDLRERREAGRGPVLVVLDPLSRLGGSDAESENAVAARLMRELGGLAVDAGAAVLVVHHTTKAARASGAADGTGIRGASALIDGARWAAELTEDGEAVKLSVVKASYGRKAAPRYLRRDDVGRLRLELPGETTTREIDEADEGAGKTRKQSKGSKGLRAKQSKAPDVKAKAAGEGAETKRRGYADDD